MSRPMRNEYAIYRGEHLLAMGTAKDCANKLGVSERYIYWLTSPTAQRRIATRKNPDKCIVGVSLNDDE
ncbi:hypothetical protein ACTHQ2_23750 [Bacillus subtilis]|uniref:hypothetical protein n=1 Tax=Bacillus subtilis TaxID=1423 RepID=UPI003F7C2A99